ncbi:MAG TPA: peptidylprolyl isomerase [Paucimonas sp.]|nr:peptidylprolyl isomerase [Paucimonas sp.]
MQRQTRQTGFLSISLLAAALTAAMAPPAASGGEVVKSRPTVGDIVKASKPADWRQLDPDNTLYIDLPAGRIVVEMAPAYAPNHVANIKALVHEGYFEGAAFLRSHDNYVAQFADPTEKREIKKAKEKLDPEFDVKLDPATPFTPLADGDIYARQAGFSNGMPAARDAKQGRMWLTHCYGMAGVARGNESDSGNGSSIYFVIGHAPRHLDRNVTVIGRVMQGMELMSSLPRGPAPLGFYDKPEMNVPIKAIRIAADVPEAERTRLEVLRTDTPTFKAVLDAMRHRGGEWYKYSPGKVELCNVPLAVRPVK